MNDQTYSNIINLNNSNGLPFQNTVLNGRLINKSQDNKLNRINNIELNNNKYISIKKAIKLSKKIVNLSNKIISSDKSQLNLLDKNQYNLNISNSEDLNKKLITKNLNDSKLILKNEPEYIRLISPFNSNLASISNHLYTFTNKSYKQINKNLDNVYIICKSAFLNMSSLISKPIISNNPDLIKITLFYYWKPSKKTYSESNLHSKFLILYYEKLENLVDLLSILFNKSVELELIRIYSPQNESNILANLIGILSNFIKFRYIHMKLFKVSKTFFNKRKFSENKLPSFLSGIYLKLAGRVLTQNTQRRVKSKVIQKGSLARTRTDLINIERFINKNKRGVFSITIKTGHIINNL